MQGRWAPRHNHEVTPTRIILRASALVGDRVEPDVIVEVTGDRISDVRRRAGEDAAPSDTVAVNGILVPGFVDVHTHGGGGGAFTVLDPDAAAAASVIAAGQPGRAASCCSSTCPAR